MLLIRLLLVPALIVLITLASRRWGPAVGGWLTGFPVVAGPIMLVISLEQGPEFAGAAALWSLSAVLANVAFGIAYSWAAIRFPWYLCFCAGTMAFGATALVLTRHPMTPWLALAVTVSGLWLAPRAFPRLRISLDVRPPPRGELAARMLAGTAMVLAVTWFAQGLGRHLSGVITVFPVLSLVLAVFSHNFSGPGYTVLLLRGVVGGLYAFATFCFVITLALPRLGTAYAFPIALLSALTVQGASFWIRHTRQMPVRPERPRGG
ncbi:MAG: hypothetical protein ABWY05_09010 [Noviherbaspirillum sp.]